MMDLKQQLLVRLLMDQLKKLLEALCTNDQLLKTPLFPFSMISLYYNVGVLNNLQLVVVLIGRLMRGVTSIAPWHLRYKICT